MDAKLTAYALNELPPDERAAFEAQLKNDLALQKQADEMKAFCKMLEYEVAQNADDVLMPAQRAQLVQSFQSSPKIIRPLWRRSAFLNTLGLAAAACLAIMFTVHYMREEPLDAARGYVTLRTDASPTMDDQDIKRSVQMKQKAERSTLVNISPAPKENEKKQLAATNVPQPAAPSAPVVTDLVIKDALTKAMPVVPSRQSDKLAFKPEPKMRMTESHDFDLSGKNKELAGKDANGLGLGGGNSYAGVSTIHGEKDLRSKSDNRIVNAEGLKKIESGASTIANRGMDIQGALLADQNKNTPAAGNENLFATATGGAGADKTITPGAPLKENGKFFRDDESAKKPATEAVASNLTKTGDGTLALNGASFYTGSTTASAGELKNTDGKGALGNNSATGTLIFSGGSLPAGGSIAATPPATSSRTGWSDASGNREEYAPSPVITSSGKISATKNKGDVAEALASAPEPALLATTTPVDGRFGGLAIESDIESRRRMSDDEVRPVPQSRAANTATYRPIIENPFTFVAQQPLSTFSLDVDTASYANVRRLLNSGQRPPPNAVRLEELVNYFPYHYEGPGADRPIAVQVNLGDAPWQPLHRIARVAVKAREVKGERTAANFVFLLDVSGSMEPQERLPLIKKSLNLLMDQLREDDRVAIVTYAGESGVALESTPGAQKEKIRQAIQKLNAGGSTNGASGIRLAYEQAASNFSKERINRVILCTDGDFNVGTSSVQELEKLIAEKAKGGVFLSVLGVGTDNLHDHTMQALADRGNGNYHYLDSVGEARKVLVEQMTGTLITVAKDVKLQVEFNPAQVAAYRLIGYEKRMLAKEDFNNDKKDAGEIGAGHTVTALYEIVPASLKYPDGKPVVDDLKYALAARAVSARTAQDESAAKSSAAPVTNETMTVKVRYKEPDSDKSKLFEVPVTDLYKKLSENDRDFQFAVSVAGFGMLLRGSPNANELTWEGVRRLALAGKGEDEQGWRGEFIQLIEKARGLCEEQR